MLNNFPLSFLLGLCLVFLTACGDSKQSQSHKDHLERAKIYQDQGQYKAAMIEYKNAVKKSNGNVSVFVDYASMLNLLGQYRSALNLLEQVKSEKSMAYYLELTRSYQGLKKYLSADGILDKNLDISVSEVKLLKAENVLGLGDVVDALSLFEGLVNDPDFRDQALLGKATALARMGKLEDSLTFLNQITPSSSAAVKANILKAGIHISNQALEEAEATLSSLLSTMRNTDVMEPEKAVVLERLSYVLTRQGRSNEAYIYTKILSEAFPGSNEVNTQFQEAVTKLDEGQLEESKQLLLNILTDYPNYSRATQLLGVISYVQGDFQTASHYLSDSVDPEVANDLTRQIYAATNLKLNDPKKVLEILEPGINKSNNPSTLALYGLAAISDEQFEKGEAALLKSIQLEDKNIRVRLALANYYRHKTFPDLQKEKAQLDEAYSIAPTDKQVLSEMTSYLIRNKGVNEAESFLMQSVVKHPESYASNFLLASFMAGQEKFQNSLKYFQTAHKYASEGVDTLNSMYGQGRVQLALEDTSAAEMTFDEMIKKFPDNLLGYKGIFSIYLLKKDDKGAFQKLEEYGEKTRQLAPFSILIEASIARQDLVSAKSYLDKLKKIDVDEKDIVKLAQGIRYVEAVMAIQAKDYSEARSIAADLISEDPENLKFLSLLVDIEVKSGQLNEAEKILSQIERINPDHPVINMFKADFALAKNDLGTARTNLSKAWDKYPSDAVGEKLYKVLGAMDDRENQSKHLKHWLEILPASSAATLYQAIAFQQTMQRTKAISAYEKVLEKLPDNVMALNNLGWIYFEKNDERSLTLLKKATELAPNNAAVLDSYGWVLAKTGDKKSGLEYLEKAAELSPNEPEIKEHLDIVRAMQ